jgi:hypothetical protein
MWSKYIVLSIFTVAVLWILYDTAKELINIRSFSSLKTKWLNIIVWLLFAIVLIYKLYLSWIGGENG